MRPIVIVSSVIVKILESRSLPKLDDDYLSNKLDRAQVGFVKFMRTDVNMLRAIERITEKLKNRANLKIEQTASVC